MELLHQQIMFSCPSAQLGIHNGWWQIIKSTKRGQEGVADNPCLDWSLTRNICINTSSNVTIFHKCSGFHGHLLWNFRHLMPHFPVSRQSPFEYNLIPLILFHCRMVLRTLCRPIYRSEWHSFKQLRDFSNYGHSFKLVFTNKGDEFRKALIWKFIRLQWHVLIISIVQKDKKHPWI